jgi:hypothetical protein
MPLVNPEDFGINTDGSQNKKYCHFCFKDGAFTWPHATLDEFTDKLIRMADKMGMSSEEASKMAREVLPTLARWR